MTLSLQVEDVIAESTDEEAGLTDKNSANVCLCQFWLLMLTVLTHYIVGCCYQMHCMAHLGGTGVRRLMRGLANILPRYPRAFNIHR